MAAVIVQYIVLRSDLKASLGWPLGAVIAQACHAATAALHENISDPQVQSYLQDMDRMHKVVLEVSWCKFRRSTLSMSVHYACSIHYCGQHWQEAKQYKLVAELEANCGHCYSIMLHVPKRVILF